MSTPSEVVVATTTTTTDLVSERVCLDQGGSYMLEAEAESENASSGFLTFDDSSEEGSTSPQHCDLLGDPRGSAAKELCSTLVSPAAGRLHPVADQVPARPFGWALSPRKSTRKRSSASTKRL